jgi:hypothetical protein
VIFRFVLLRVLCVSVYSVLRELKQKVRTP